MNTIPRLTGSRLLPVLTLWAFVFSSASHVASQTSDPAEPGFPVPAIEYDPRTYVCLRAADALTIDGRLDEPDWQAAVWTEPFTDIEGPARPAPYFSTRAKMLWDDEYFYIGAYLEEPHLWGTLTRRDAVIYHDNDFEVFIDPNGDAHEYYELEINALGTEWDLLLIRPYRDGAPAVNAWDIQGLKTAVALDGTLNDPADRDSGWSVEIALPWSVLAECAHRPSPPGDGDTWWVNFSRVHWRLEVVDGRYAKRVDSATGKPLPEHNWVWSPQGLIAMHYPEMWGLVQFSSARPGAVEAPEFVAPLDIGARKASWQIYYAQREYERVHHRYAARLGDLTLPPVSLAAYQWPPELHASEHAFTVVLRHAGDHPSLKIDHEGRLTAVDTSGGRR